jgi:hypothetical protein
LCGQKPEDRQGKMIWQARSTGSTTTIKARSHTPSVERSH